MRIVTSSLLLLSLASAALAQSVPTTINYQGRLTDNTPAQTPVNATVQMQFAIYDAATGGTRLWQEPAADNTGTSVTVTTGIFNYVLGNTTAIPPTVFSGATSVRYLQITLNPAASAEILAPRQLISASGYANLAQNANAATTAATATTASSLAANGSNCPAGSYPLGITADGAAENCTVAGTGTVTSVTANAPLSVVNGTTTPAITITSPLPIVNGGTGNTAGNALTATALAANGANCPAGQYPHGVNAAGAAEGCSAVPIPVLPLSISWLDEAGDVGTYTSIAMGSDGLGLISYYDQGFADLKVAHCADLACTYATIATLDFAGSVGQYTSLTIGVDGLGLISYYDITNGDLKVAHCANVACSSATLATLDTVGLVGSQTSITIGVDGLGLISYWDQTNNDLKVAHCMDVACSSATFTTLDAAGNFGQFSSITIGSDGLGLISYYDGTNFDLKVAHCANLACSSASLATLDSVGTVGLDTSLTMSSNGLGLISYYDSTNGDLKLAYCADVPCSSAFLTALDTGGSVGRYSSITIGNNSQPQISYYDGTNGNLKLAQCADAACFSWSFNALDSAGDDVGRYTSIMIGTDGLGLISYLDFTNFDLKVAHDAKVALLNGGQIFSGINYFSNAANSFTGSFTGNGAGLTNVTASGLAAGTYPNIYIFNNALNSFTGSGGGLTDLNASNLFSGTVPQGRLGSNVALLDMGQVYSASNVFSGGNTFSALNNSFTGGGAGLYALNATNISSGNLAVARMPTGGAWTLSSNLNLDANTLVVDQANNRVGVATAAPDSAFVVSSPASSPVRIGDTGCGAGFGGIGLYGPMSAGCTNYTMIGESGVTKNLFINRPTGANIHFRMNNADQMILNSNGSLSIGVRHVSCTLGPSPLNCSCAAGETVVSGGAYGGAGISLRESRPTSTTNWVVSCMNNVGANVACSGVNIICARLAP